MAISTLRGELADNEEWKVDPARPAIIIGTVDMIGSKLLFSGYGDGRYLRTQHAGLVGQDSLIVHDEAHLTPAFSDLLYKVNEVQREDCELRLVQIMELSATSRGSAGTTLGLEPEDEQDDVVRQRLNATKLLQLHRVETKPQDKPADARKKTLEKIVELGLRHKDAQAKVLIYVRSPEDAQKIGDMLSSRLGDKEPKRTALLTGTIRGYERDNLVRTDPVYRSFLNHDVHVDLTMYLVSTAAGEVGIDIDANHMVCDLTTLDSLIQRLGRVNRRGGPGRKAQVDVVLQTTEDDRDSETGFKAALTETLDILNEWVGKSGGAIDVSPRGLRSLLDGLDPERKEGAFSPKPPVPPLTDILLDAWSLTSITKQMPARPEVEAYLHGLENDPPETYVTWRSEVTRLHDAGIEEDVMGDWFHACRIEAQERLREQTSRVQMKLDALLANQRKRQPDRDFPVVLLNERGEAEWKQLSQIVQKEFNIRYRTVVLPIEAAGLSEKGMLDAGALDPIAHLDVAEERSAAGNGRRRERWLLTRDADGERYERLTSGESAESLPSDLKEREQVTLKEAAEGAEEEGQVRYLLFMSSPGKLAAERAETAKVHQPLDFHLGQIAGQMQRIADALGLEKRIKEALVIAAKWHDRGKGRLIWQQYACNEDPGAPLAKSSQYRDGRFLGGYRHEFGSLLDAAADPEIQKHSEADLILHLIAAHHGWARPHFESNAGDNSYTTSDNEEAAAEVMRRYGRLQQRFGRWGLAWLESLVRCADIAASKEVST